jgi:hypothetical protein
MSGTCVFSPGGYRFIPAVFQYSGGIAAEAGFAIERVVLRGRPKLGDGFRQIEGYLRSIGRPLAAFAACELQSPGQFSEAGFRAFNQHYCETLARWGVYDAETKINSVARSNVCPLINPPSEPSLHAFSYTVPARTTSSTFVVAGSGEAREGQATYADHIVRRGETSPDAMADKARAVLAEMERRLSLLGFTWRDTTATQVYTVHEIHSFLGSEIIARGVAPNGIVWHLSRPPIVGLEFEMDCRGIATERVVEARDHGGTA